MALCLPGLRAASLSALLRRLVLLTLLGATGLLASGCGFALRQPPELARKHIALRGFDRNSGMADELRRQLRASPGVTVVEMQDPADAVLTALQDTLDRVVAASTAAGQVTEITLHARLRFEVRDAAGRLLIASTELQLSRDMSYSENAALAKAQEARLMGRAMQADLASQVLRRLAALPAAPAVQAP